MAESFDVYRKAFFFLIACSRLPAMGTALVHRVHVYGNEHFGYVESSIQKE